MRTAVRILTANAAWLVVAGAVLLGTGFVFVITAPPNSGANIGAAGCFTLGLGATGLALLLGVAAAFVRLLAGRGPDVELLAWEKRLRWLTRSSIGLFAVAAVVLSWATLVLANQTAPAGVASGIIGMEKAFPIFVSGLCIAGAGLLAGLPPTVRYWSRPMNDVAR
ncbi:hypothetical protein [Amycolatopsis sp. WGS_07]|uniref:hypothetical protein n=1 Tax=Amycolatopsis sp. WGS_07 TaxID=3076764 RepID=UPI00387328AA